MYSLKSEPDTYYTLPSTVKWSGGKKESGAGRRTTNPAARPRSGRLGSGSTPVVASILWDPLRWHWRDRQPPDAGRELCLPDLLTSIPPPIEHQAHHECTQKLVQQLEEAHDMLRKQQVAVRQEDNEEPPLFQTGDLVLLQNVRRKKGKIRNSNQSL